MGKSSKSAWELEREKVFGDEMRVQMHATPSEAHIKRAAEYAGLDGPDLLPRFDSVAGLLVYVQSLRAAGGSGEAFNIFVDRFQPKPSRPQVAVITPGANGGAPMASRDNEEQSSAQRYYDDVMNA